jgi:hypothetical protein
MARRYYDQLIGDRRETIQTIEHILVPLQAELPRSSERWRGKPFGLRPAPSIDPSRPSTRPGSSSRMRSRKGLGVPTSPMASS